MPIERSAQEVEMRNVMRVVACVVVVFGGLSISAHTSALHHASSGSRCQPRGHTDVSYYTGGEIANTNASVDREFTCSIENTYDGAGTTDWSCGAGCVFAGLDVRDDSASHNFACETYALGFGTGGWTWSGTPYASSSGTGRQTLGLDAVSFAAKDFVGFRCVIPRGGTSKIYGYYVIY